MTGTDGEPRPSSPGLSAGLDAGEAGEAGNGTTSTLGSSTGRAHEVDDEGADRPEAASWTSDDHGAGDGGARRQGASDDQTGAARRPAGRRLVGGLAGMAALAAVAGVMARPGGNDDAGDGDGGGATTTATVERRDLVTTDSYEGQLGFGATSEVAAGRSGVITSVAAVGTTVAIGAQLFAIDLEPTLLLRGTVPAFRQLDTSATPGADVAQLEQALVEAGFGDSVTVDDDYTSATATAVEAWETTLGRAEPDGVVDRGDVVFAPAGVRVEAIAADVGTQVEASGTVVETTATAHVVTLDLTVDEASRVEPGAEVEIELPDGSAATGTVIEIGTVAEPEPEPEVAAGAAGTTETEATQPVTVTFDDAATAAGIDSGTVEVGLERSRVDDATAVPVTALLALAEGGYAVQVVDPSEPGGHRLVGVEVGTIADEWAEVTGEGIEPGVDVVVPA